MDRLCGAKTRRGGICQRIPAEGKDRCRWHGGLSTGNQKGTQSANAWKHGIYSKKMTGEELIIAQGLTFGRVDDELRLTKIRLMRALNAENERGNTLEIDSSVERDGGGKMVVRAEEIFKVRDYSTMIDRLTGRIQSLERDRLFLVEASLNNELKAAATMNLRADKDESPIQKIIVEVVSASNSQG